MEIRQERKQSQEEINNKALPFTRTLPFPFAKRKELKGCTFHIRSNLHKSKMGYGSKIRFWHDLWCKDQPLKAVFPKVFSIAHNKKALVAEHVQFIDDTLQRNITFTNQ